MAEEFDKAFWDAQKWVEEQDIQLAEDTGYSRERIRQIRHDYGYPECKYKGRNREKVKFEKAIEKIEVSTMTLKEISALTGKPEDYVARALSGLGKKAKSANIKYDWKKVDWSKTPKTISDELGASPNYVARQGHKYRVTQGSA